MFFHNVILIKYRCFFRSLVVLFVGTRVVGPNSVFGEVHINFGNDVVREGREGVPVMRELKRQIVRVRTKM